jgi:DNA-binding response OmpR family regulator
MSRSDHSRSGDGPILIVDDSRTNLQMLGAIFETAGFSNLVLAGGGQEALDRLQDLDPSLIVLDLVMPEIDGFEVCRRIRAEPRLAGVPILVQTGLTDPKDRTQAFRAGATDVVTKPIDGRELIARARVHLENGAILRGLEGYRDAMEREIGLAHTAYGVLTPPESTLQAAVAGRIRLRAITRSGTDFGGDVWAAAQLPGGRIGIHLQQIAGNGVIAAVTAFSAVMQLDAEVWAGRPLQALPDALCPQSETGSPMFNPPCLVYAELSASSAHIDCISMNGAVMVADGPVTMMSSSRWQRCSVPMTGGRLVALVTPESLRRIGGLPVVQESLSSGNLDQAARMLDRQLGPATSQPAAILLLSGLKPPAAAVAGGRS